MAKLGGEINIGMKWHAFVISGKIAPRCTGDTNVRYYSVLDGGNSQDYFQKFREIDIVSIDLDRKVIKVIDTTDNDRISTYSYVRKYIAEYTLKNVLELEIHHQTKSDMSKGHFQKKQLELMEKSNDAIKELTQES